MSDLADAIGRAILTDTDPADALTVVRRAADADQAASRLLQQSVTAARAGGHSWSAIGDTLGLTRQAAQQRFGKEKGPDDASPTDAEERWLGPVTAFDEMAELEIAGRLGWHTIDAGMLRHRVVRTATQWEHRRVMWPVGTAKLEQDGWQIAVRAFPWIYLIRDTGEPALSE